MFLPRLVFVEVASNVLSLNWVIRLSSINDESVGTASSNRVPATTLSFTLSLSSNAPSLFRSKTPRSPRQTVPPVPGQKESAKPPATSTQLLGLLGTMLLTKAKPPRNWIFRTALSPGNSAGAVNGRPTPGTSRWLYQPFLPPEVE